LQAYALTAVPKWRIPMEGNISPYIGPKAGLAYVTASVNKHGGSFNDAVFIWGAVLGADIFLSKQTALFVEYDYTQFNFDAKLAAGGTATSGRIRVRDNGITAGLAYWW
jgi:opacity protein-like surface antigen